MINRIMQEETNDKTPEDQNDVEEKEASAEQPDAPGADTPSDLDKQLASTREQLLRKAADFENYKKRTEAEIQNIVRYANENLILAVLPIVDDLERSLKAGKPADSDSAFYAGVELIYQKLHKVLDANGVTPLETVGKPFDVHFHDALMQMPTAEAEPHTVLEEVQKGYEMNGKVIRHAKVVVAAPPQEPADKKGEDV